MQTIEEIEKKIKDDINENEILRIMKDYKTPQDKTKVLIVQHVLKASSFAKLIDILINEKYNQILFAGVKRNGN